MPSGAPTAAPKMTFTARPACPICRVERREVVWQGRHSDEPVRSWVAWHHYAEDAAAALGGAPISLARCGPCGIVFHRWVPSDEGLARLYGAWIDAAQIERFERENGGVTPEIARLRRARHVVARLLRLHRIAGSPASFRVVDVGCGDGVALEAAACLGFEAWGVDPSPTRTARARAPGRIVPSLDVLEGLGLSFDAAIAMEVLEHLVEPRACLEALARVVRAQGALLVEVPDARGVRGPPRSFDEFRRVMPLEHLNGFSPRGLSRLASLTGFVAAPRVRVGPDAGPEGRAAVLAAELLGVLRDPGTQVFFLRA